MDSEEVENGRSVKEVCREYEVSNATFYKLKSKYGGMEASDIRRLKDFEEENWRLKQMYADLSRENRALKSVIEKSYKASGAARTGRSYAVRAWVDCPEGLFGGKAKPIGLLHSALSPR